MLWETLILWLSNAAIALPQFFVNNEKGTSRRLPPILINFDYNSSEFVQWVTALLMINCTGSTGYALIKNNRSSLKPICDCRVYCCRWADNLLWHLQICELETVRQWLWLSVVGIINITIQHRASSCDTPCLERQKLFKFKQSNILIHQKHWVANECMPNRSLSQVRWDTPRIETYHPTISGGLIFLGLLLKPKDRWNPLFEHPVTTQLYIRHPKVENKPSRRATSKTKNYQSKTLQALGALLFSQPFGHQESTSSPLETEALNWIISQGGCSTICSCSHNMPVRQE